MLNKAVVAFFCAMALAALPGPAAAQRSDGDGPLDLAGAEIAITQQMAKDALLVALDINREQALRSLDASRARFDRVLTGLREGDSMLGLSPASNPELIAEIDRAEGLWSQMDSEIRAGFAAGAFAPDRVIRIAGVSMPLLEAMESVAEVHAEENPNGQLFSMLVVAIDLSNRQRILAEQMTKELLLVAHGRNVEMHRSLLRQVAIQFDETLDGLIHGDLDLLLLPAPTDAIKERLAEVERIWQVDMQPIIRMAIDGDPLGRSTILRIAEINARLVEQSGQVVALYGQL